MALSVVTAATVRYTHHTLGEDVPIGIAGYYTPLREVRLVFRGREVLYIVGRAVIESSCCGSGSWDYALVPGYIVQWHSAARGRSPVSEVEPVADRSEQEELRRLIEAREGVTLVSFW